MKSMTLIVIACCCMSLNAQEKLTAKYQPDRHLLSVNAQNADISELLEVLAKENFQLFIVDLDRPFKVNGNFNAAPVDEVLEKLIPERYHYYYRLSEEAEKTAFEQNNFRKFQNPDLKQEGDMTTGASGPNTILIPPGQLQNLGGKLRIKPVVVNRDDALGNLKPKLLGTGSMLSVTKVKQGVPPLIDREEILNPPTSIPEHLVVTFKITKSGIVPVAASYEAGAYVAPDEKSVRGDHALIGIENEDIVLVEPLEDPLEARSIFDPENKIEHGSFKQEENYISIKMPKKYDQLINSNRLKLQFGKINDLDRERIYLNTRLKKLKVSDLNNVFELKRSNSKLDLGNIRIQKRK